MTKILMKMLMKIMLVLTDCGFSGSRGAQMNGYSHLPANDKVLEERIPQIQVHTRDVFIRWRVQITRETFVSDFNGQSDMRGSPFEPI